jgi:hypothetical protein
MIHHTELILPKQPISRLHYIRYINDIFTNDSFGH